MRTEKQLQASRLNGAKSRGPVTAEGKHRVSRNAVTHGFYSQQILLAGENHAEFHSLAARYYDQFQPADHLETELVDMMIAARWRQLRLWNIQRDTMDVASRREYNQAPGAAIPATVLISAGFKTECDNSRAMEVIARQESRYERQFMRAHKRLMDLRANPHVPGPGPQLVPIPAPDDAPALDTRIASASATPGVTVAESFHKNSKQTQAIPRAQRSRRSERRAARRLRRSQQREIFLSDPHSDV